MSEEEKPSVQAQVNKAKKEKKKRAKAKKRDVPSSQVPAASAASGNAKRVATLNAPKSRIEEEEDEDVGGLKFEDPFEDEFEEEEHVNEGDDEDVMRDDDEDDKPNTDGSVGNNQNAYFNPYKPVTEDLGPMEFDPSAYGAIHQMKLDWPALSFDFFRDHLGIDRTRFPTSVWFIAGTQALQANQNGLNLVRVSNFCRTKQSDDLDDGMVVEDDEEMGDPTLEYRSLSLVDGAVNRVRAMPQEPGVVAVWSESGKVHLYDARKQLQSLNLDSAANQGGLKPYSGPVYTMNKHQDEGYAMDWSLCKSARLATGDCKGSIYVWDVDPVGGVGLSNAYLGHKGSVEDVQWSPSQENCFATCGVDGTIKIWDTRAPERKHSLSQRGHDQDINVLAWNPKIEYLLASGSDDASFKVWDLRRFEASAMESQVAWFKNFHTDAITSLQWSPHDESVIAACSADHQTTVWDMALEEDKEFAREAAADFGFSEDVLDDQGQRVNIPPQLLFVHAGVQDPKEVRFHPQVVGLIGVTGESGFDLFICEPLDPKSQLANDL
ncbi:hypothetical protein BASA81_005433 [Batrachochytrium salamandrivorans]|nr:hypothetical protein BASA81_005433 [Batrachochytrium salamandrivorans]